MLAAITIWQTYFTPKPIMASALEKLSSGFLKRSMAVLSKPPPGVIVYPRMCHLSILVFLLLFALVSYLPYS